MFLLSKRLSDLDGVSDAVARATTRAEEKVEALGVNRICAAVIVAEYLCAVLEEAPPEEILADGLAALRARREAKTPPERTH